MGFVVSAGLAKTVQNKTSFGEKKSQSRQLTGLFGGERTHLKRTRFERNCLKDGTGKGTKGKKSERGGKRSSNRETNKKVWKKL